VQLDTVEILIVVNLEDIAAVSYEFWG